MRTLSGWFALFCVALCVLCSVHASRAAKQPTFIAFGPEAGWRVVAAPYLWAGQMSGSVQVPGDDHTITDSFAEVFTQWNLSVGAHTEVDYGSWGLGLDPLYIPFSGSATSEGVRIRLMQLEGDLYYRLYFRYLQGGHSSTLDCVGGGRYFFVKALFSHRRANLEGSVSVVAPTLGLRYKYRAGAKLNFSLSGDVGGFGADGVETTWGLLAGVSYKIRPGARLVASYKLLKINIKKSSLCYKSLIYGPVIGLSFSSNPD